MEKLIILTEKAGEVHLKNDFLADMGSRIAKRRKELHLTQETVADRMGVSLQTVSCIELGKKAIRPDNLAKLCKALDVTSDYILLGERSENQMSDFVKKISKLSADDYHMIEEMVEHLSNKN